MQRDSFCHYAGSAIGHTLAKNVLGLIHRKVKGISERNMQDVLAFAEGSVKNHTVKKEAAGILLLLKE